MDSPELVLRQAKNIETYVPRLLEPGHPGSATVQQGPPRCINQYTIEATVLRIFVSQQLLDDGILDNPLLLPPDTPTEESVGSVESESSNGSDWSVATTESASTQAAGSIVFFEELPPEQVWG